MEVVEVEETLVETEDYMVVEVVEVAPRPMEERAAAVLSI